MQWKIRNCLIIFNCASETLALRWDEARRFDQWGDNLREFADVCDTPQAGVGQGRYAQEGGDILPFELKQVSGAQSYSLLPNPNNGNFIVRQLVADDKPVNAEVWNSVGAKVWSGKLAFSGRQTSIRLGGMASGGYLLKLYDSKGQHYTIKFIIIE